MIHPMPAVVRDSIRTIPKPATADSLAGVLARLFPDLVDSADVGKIGWRQSPKTKLGEVSAATYGYRPGPVPDRFTMVPVIAKADRERGMPVVTFATRDWPKRGDGWSNDPDVVKHEMFHAMSRDVRDRGHDPERNALFKLLEAYRGR